MSLIDAIYRTNYVLADQLIMNGCGLDDTYLSGCTPLMLLLLYPENRKGKYKLFLVFIAKLIDAGADVNIKNDDGKTALIYSMCFNRSIYTVRMLIDAGADVNIKNNYGKTALIYAVKKNVRYSFIDAVKMLIEADF